MEDNKAKVDQSRRSFIQKAVYAAPAILTLSAMPFTASYGSQQVSDAKPWDTRSMRDKSFEWNSSFNEWDHAFKWPDRPDKSLNWRRVRRNNRD
jgi:hypothetical protein